MRILITIKGDDMCDRCDFLARRGGGAQAEADWHEEWRRTTRAHIAEHGVSIVCVDAGVVQFAYTVGLWLTRAHPELAIIGLEPDLAQLMLNVVSEPIRDRRWRLAENDTFDTGTRILRAVPLANPERVVVQANEYVGLPVGESVPVLQLIYTDVHGVWPSEPHCHLFPEQQTLPDELVA